MRASSPEPPRWGGRPPTWPTTSHPLVPRDGLEQARAEAAGLREMVTRVHHLESPDTKALPSAHDRGDYRAQQQQLRRMASGDLESVRIRSTDMHQHGLAVPVAGERRVVRDGAGRPERLLLRAEERTAH